MTATTGGIPGQRSGASPEDMAAERFMTAFKHIEQELGQRWAKEVSDQRVPVPPMVDLLRWARRRRILTADAEDFLHACRNARNAYAHVAFDDYVGPVTLPPEPVAQRVERISQALRNPALAGAVATTAVTCEATTTLVVALRTMHEHGFSQLPYRHPELGWLLVTQDQVGRWVAAHTEEDGTVIADLGVGVGRLADDRRVGPVIPVVLPASAPVGQVVRHLEHALATKDSEPGGYPVVLVISRGKPCRLVAGEDLPHLYDVLGR